MQEIAKVFALKPHALKVGAAVELGALVVLLVALIVLLGIPQYSLRLIFAVLFVALSDPSADRPYTSRVRWCASVAIVGALLTALGFGLGVVNWVLVALAAFLTTLLSGFAAAYGKQAALAAYLLIIWFIIALALPHSYALVPWPAQAGPQALAWLAGGALWIVLPYVLSQRKDQQLSPAEPPQQPAPVKLSRPLILFSVLRAFAVSVAVAIAWGFKPPHADWMPVAALVVMKPGLEESLLAAEQRVTGAILGALLAAGFLTVVHDKYVLAVVIVVFGALADVLHDANYAIYYSFMAAAVLIGLGVMLLAGLATKGRKQGAPQGVWPRVKALVEAA